MPGVGWNLFCIAPFPGGERGGVIFLGKKSKSTADRLHN